MKRGQLICPTRLALVCRILALASGALAVGSPVQAGFILLPPGLQPGDPFQVAFVTSGTFSAELSDISYYNSVVTNAATAAGLDTIDGQAVTWHAIASTAAINALDNALQTAPVYDLQGQLITATPGGLWTSNQHFLNHPIDVTELGNPLIGGYVWTGSNQLGMGFPEQTLGNDLFLVAIGDLSSIFPSWIWIAAQPPDTLLHLYALSSPLIVPYQSTVPEPSSLQLGVLALAALLTWWRLIGHRRASKREGSRAPPGGIRNRHCPACVGTGSRRGY